MSVKTKLITIVLFVALVPVSISAYTMLRVHRDSFGQKLTELHKKTAELGAARAESSLENGLKVLSNLIRDHVDWAALSDTERTQVLWLVYEQLESVVVASLLDEHGQGIGSSVYRDASARTQSLQARPIMTDEELEAYGRNLPIAGALRDGQAMGQAVPPSGDRGATIPLAFAVAGPDGQRWVVGVGLSLTQVCAALTKERTEETDVALLDAAGAPLCAGLANSARLSPALARMLPLTAATTMHYTDGDNTEVLAAAAPAGVTWTVVTTQLASSAFASRRRIQQQIIFWIGFGILGALLAGIFLARSITRPIANLSEATEKIAAGTYDVALPVEGNDEFAQLATAFNTMGAEIASWNTELKNRVDERTKALTEAQGQLVESKKMAAVAAMSAGIAHEINNPLTAVITFAQVLETRARKDPAQAKQAGVLGKLADSALRIRDIVQRMQRLAEEAGQGMTDQQPLDIVKAATATLESRLGEAGIQLRIDSEPDLPLVYVHRGQLEHALMHILDNSVKAMKGDRRRLTVAIKKMGTALVQIDISDTGKGIPGDALEKIFEPFFTLKDQWQGQGLGLAEAHQIVTSNHGTIRVRSAVGEGTTITLAFPVTSRRAHLV